jgi:UDP-2,3-diacylglucosamine pyrophosphatase LpxH
MHDAIIISDLHLGTRCARTEKLVQFLLTLPPTKRLIINGDLLESSNKRLKQRDWDVLVQLRQLKTELIWVSGNHDADAGKLAMAWNIAYAPSYTFRSKDADVICVHGDVFDVFLFEHPIVTYLLNELYLFSQHHVPRFSVWAKHLSKQTTQCTDRVRAGALSLARATGAKIVVCGHVHEAETFNHDGIAYCNTGCWTEPSSHFLVVQDGVAILKEIR